MAKGKTNKTTKTDNDQGSAQLKAKAAAIAEILDSLYPAPPIPLKHEDAYTLLVAVVLSAQATDKSVNLATPHLYARADNPYDMVKLSPEEILHYIRAIGFANVKSKYIWELSRQLIEKHGGQVPQTFEELEALPGVGHKTASVVMSQAFGFPAFPVDTHIFRLAARWGLSDGKTVEKTESDLKALYPEKDWNKLHLQIIYFGREFCPARGHIKEKCPICSIYGV